MSGMNRTPLGPVPHTSPLPPTGAAQGLAVLNVDGHDVRSWWQLDTAERAARMDKQDQAWWTRYRLWIAAEVLRIGIIRATEGLK